MVFEFFIFPMLSLVLVVDVSFDVTSYDICLHKLFVNFYCGLGIDGLHIRDMF